MELEKSSLGNNKDDEVMLPGFRFHPTDEELVGFYLTRKVEKKAIRGIDQLIKQIDIYKYDPWDLPIGSVGDKEWYFYCIRGRKYRNSIRPNRVTGSGFWKATGIDKPVYAVGEPHDCIGLKKSLVYYRGSAGKGTKTDWMMHEFRLPPTAKHTNLTNLKTVAQEAEVWTLCRIFKRSTSYRKYIPVCKESSIKQNPTTDSCSKTCSLDSDNNNDQYLSFGDSIIEQNERKCVMERRNQILVGRQTNSIAQAPLTASYSSFWNENGDEYFFKDRNWDDLGSVVELAMDPSHFYRNWDELKPAPYSNLKLH